MKKQLYFFGGIAFIILVVFLIAPYLQTGYIGGGGLSHPTELVDWKGIDVSITAAVFGTASNGQATKTQIPNPHASEPGWYIDVWTQHDFCGDEGVTISNNYEVSDKFIMSSFMTSVDKNCAGNYIYSEFEIPRGELTGVCDLSVDGIEGSSSCKVFVDSDLIFSNEFKRLGDKFEGSNSKSLKLVFDEPTKIKIELVTNTGGGSGSTSKSDISLIFKEKVVAVDDIEEVIELIEQGEEVLECLANINCVDICGNYRPTCMNNICLCERDSDDKLILPYVDDSFVSKLLRWLKSLLGGL